MPNPEKTRINYVCQGGQIIDNSFLDVYINDYVKKFRNYNKDEFIIDISGLKMFWFF